MISSPRREPSLELVLNLPSPKTSEIVWRTVVDGVIVSNDGGHDLDWAVSALRVLPAILRAAGAMTVMMDGGVRRGTDALEALASGAHFVSVNRPFNYAAGKPASCTESGCCAAKSLGISRCSA